MPSTLVTAATGGIGSATGLNSCSCCPCVTLAGAWSLVTKRNTWGGERAYFRPGHSTSFDRNTLEAAAEALRTNGTSFVIERFPVLVVRNSGVRFAVACGDTESAAAMKSALSDLAASHPAKWAFKLPRTTYRALWRMDINDGVEPGSFEPQRFFSQTQGAKSLPLWWETARASDACFKEFLVFAQKACAANPCLGKPILDVPASS